MKLALGSVDTDARQSRLFEEGLYRLRPTQAGDQHVRSRTVTCDDRPGWCKVDLNLLKVLAVMLEERSVARCADRLFVSPSAVSHALARLRTMFSDPLFVRSGGAMLPTIRAQSLERSLSLLSTVLNAELEKTRGSQCTTAFNPAESVSDVKIVSPGALELTLVPAVIAILHEQAPNWTLTVEPFERRSYESDLATGRVDFVLSIGGTTPVGALVDGITLWEDELVVLAGPRSDLYDCADRISTELFLAHRHVYPLPWPISQNYLDVELARRGQHRNIAVSLPSYAALGHLLETTDLVSSLPDRSARSLMRSHADLKLLRLEPARRSELSLLWGIAAAQEPAIAWIRDIIQRAAGELESFPDNALSVTGA